MATAVVLGKTNLYFYLWRPDEIGITIAKELIKPLTQGLKELEDNPEYYKKYDSENGWGLYVNFVPFVRSYLKACKKNPDSIIYISR